MTPTTTLTRPSSAVAADGATGALGWTAIDTPLGAVVAIAGDRGVAAVRIGPDRSALLDELRDEFDGDTLEPADQPIDGLATALDSLAAGGPAGVDLPLDIEGTEFQWLVWESIRRIPSGQTRTYAEIADEIGRPTSVRAVANACGANPVALVIPCHRVVRSDGGLGGYRWGIEVKRQLLEAEGALPH